MYASVSMRDGDDLLSFKETEAGKISIFFLLSISRRFLFILGSSLEISGSRRNRTLHKELIPISSSEWGKLKEITAGVLCQLGPHLLPDAFSPTLITPISSS